MRPVAKDLNSPGTTPIASPRTPPTRPVPGFAALLGCAAGRRLGSSAPEGLRSSAASARVTPKTTGTSTAAATAMTATGTSAAVTAGATMQASADASANASGSRATREGVDDPLDPSTRRAAQLAPPPGWTPIASPQATSSAEAAPRGPMSLEHMLPALVRRIAWAGDARRGTVRLEIGAGSYDGATLLVHADDGAVRVVVGGRASGDLDALRERIAARLAKRGVVLDGVK
jgi:hypothetical protein